MASGSIFGFEPVAKISTSGMARVIRSSVASVLKVMRHLELAQFPLVPPDQRVLVLLEIGNAARDHHAAEPVRLLVERDDMAPERGDARGLHAGDAAADHHDVLARERRRQLVVGLAPAGRVHRARHLPVGRRAAPCSLPGSERHGRMRSILPALHLLRQIRIGEQRPREADQVGLAGPDRFDREVRVVHPPGRDDRNADRLLQDRVERQVQALGLVHRRMAPVPAVIGADVAVEGVVARPFQDLGRLDPLGDVAAPFLERLRRACRPCSQSLMKLFSE